MEGSVSVQVCKTWVQNADGTVGCTHLEWIQTYLLPPEAEGYLTLLMGGFDPSAFRLGFAGTIGLFAVGLGGAGLIISAMRKARN
ncbi:Uncharacterised protein [Pseudomonas aeruginosa]|uniref:hypothetical protein n=1 Tax=Pseudomonas aeruginosa TaxID=287 RepID=UPI001EF71B5C|nr:hypothetical protein [Pseudomonas aeruginosa]CAC9224749.1 Uncharacterised protein [Pseudomonas aeruginosa]